MREADERKRVNAERRRQREAQSTGGTAPARTKGGSQQAPQHNLLLLTATQQGSLNSKGGDSSTAEDVLTTVKEAMSAKPSEPTKNKRMGKVEMKVLLFEWGYFVYYAYIVLSCDFVLLCGIIFIVEIGARVPESHQG